MEREGWSFRDYMRRLLAFLSRVTVNKGCLEDMAWLGLAWLGQSRFLYRDIILQRLRLKAEM
jgi:hypothetical protein